jgi:preprotein translocase subunit YajC
MNPQAYIAQQTASPSPGPEAAGPQGEQPGGLFGNFTFLIMIAAFAVMYFILIRPQRKEEKRRKEMLSALKKGDSVVTTGGIIGSVHSIKQDGDSIILKVGDNTRIEVLRSAINSVREPSAGGDAVGDKTEKVEKADKFPSTTNSKKSAKK